MGKPIADRTGYTYYVLRFLRNARDTRGGEEKKIQFQFSHPSCFSRVASQTPMSAPNKPVLQAYSG